MRNGAKDNDFEGCTGILELLLLSKRKGIFRVSVARHHGAQKGRWRWCLLRGSLAGARWATSAAWELQVLFNSFLFTLSFMLNRIWVLKWKLFHVSMRWIKEKCILYNSSHVFQEVCSKQNKTKNELLWEFVKKRVWRHGATRCRATKRKMDSTHSRVEIVGKCKALKRALA